MVGGLFLYDFFFWFGHVALHKLLPRRLYGRAHGKHHRSRDVRASDTVRLTMFEETVDVMCSIAALRLLKVRTSEIGGRGEERGEARDARSPADRKEGTHQSEHEKQAEQAKKLNSQSFASSPC